MTIRTPIAALLLTLQALAGGAVPLAHAGEPETAPATIEAHHDASCVVLHDALRCALCYYAGCLGAPPRAPALGMRQQVATRHQPREQAGERRSLAHAGARPRAPPSPLS